VVIVPSKYFRKMHCKPTNEIPPNVPRISIQYYEPYNVYTTSSSILPIDGISYIPNFLTNEQEERIWEICYSHSWSSAIHRRQQFWGQVYFHTTQDVSTIQPIDDGKSTGPVAHDLHHFDFLLERLITLGYFTADQPPTQILVNEYVGPMGIASHFDDENAFGDTVVTVSLGQPVWLSLVQPRLLTNQCQDIENETKILIEPNSLFGMQRDIRYKWRHGISKSRWVMLPDGSGIKRTLGFVRLSLTIRKLLEGRKRVCTNSKEWISV
jgi:alkylated DNA repair dioxygenase AlkB